MSCNSVAASRLMQLASEPIGGLFECGLSCPLPVVVYSGEAIAIAIAIAAVVSVYVKKS